MNVAIAGHQVSMWSSRPGGLGNACEGDVLVEHGPFALGGGQGGAREHSAELFLDAPRGADLVGRIVLSQHRFQLRSRPRSDRVS